MNSHNLANLEALINIIANSIEIFAIVNGFELILGGLSLLFIAKWSASAKLILFGFVIILCGLAVPGFINWCIAGSIHSPDLGTVQTIGLLLIVILGPLMLLALLVGIGFFPTIVAFKRKKRNRKLIL